MLLKNTEISVIMSVYNSETWLKESIQSVLDQTFTNFEFIIINDGSNDRSSQIIENFKKKDSRIRVINNNENIGLANSLNKGILASKGNWIARIDADDICYKSRFKDLISLSKTFHNTLLFGSSHNEINEKGEILRHCIYPSKSKRLKFRLITKGGFFSHSSAFYSRKLVEDLGGYRPQIHRAEDYDLWLRISEKTQIICATKPLVSVRQHNSQISKENGMKRQIVDSNVALVLFFLRKLKIEPKLESENFNKLMKTVDNDFDKSSSLEYLIFIDFIKSKLRKTELSARGLLTLLFYILKQPKFTIRWTLRPLYEIYTSLKITGKYISAIKNQGV